MNTRAQFDKELEQLSTDLIQMGALTTDAFEQALKALRQRNKTLAQTVIENDDAVNAMERHIEQRCLRLLLRQQPVAGDLRKISTAIKMITDIERIGDAAADISEISMFVDGQPFPDIEPQVYIMGAAAMDMVKASIDAFVREDLKLARETMRADDVVDHLFDKIKGLLAIEIAKSGCPMDTAIDYLMIIKYLERVGDHAVNICEWVEFYMTGIHKREKIL